MIAIDTPTLAEIGREFAQLRGVVPDKWPVSLATLIGASNEIRLLYELTGKPIFIKRDNVLMQIHGSPPNTPLHGLMVFGMSLVEKTP